MFEKGKWDNKFFLFKVCLISILQKFSFSRDLSFGRHTERSAPPDVIQQRHADHADHQA